MHSFRPTYLFTLLLPIAGLLFGAGCDGNRPAASSPPPKPPSSPPPTSDGPICTEIGCVDGFHLTLNKAHWEPGSYSFHIEADGAVTDCTGKLPLNSCDGSPSLTCTGAKHVLIGESGCAMAPDQQGFSNIDFDAAPAKITVSISRDGAELINQSFEPNYVDSRPNGPECEPVCHQASGDMTLGTAMPD